MAAAALNAKPAAATRISPFFMTHGYEVRPIEMTARFDEEPRNPNPANEARPWFRN